MDAQNTNISLLAFRVALNIMLRNEVIFSRYESYLKVLGKTVFSASPYLYFVAVHYFSLLIAGAKIVFFRTQLVGGIWYIKHNWTVNINTLAPAMNSWFIKTSEGKKSIWKKPSCCSFFIRQKHLFLLAANGVTFFLFLFQPRHLETSGFNIYWRFPLWVTILIKTNFLLCDSMQLVGKKKSNIPKALNICIPPYFPSNRTVLLSGLKARHILTKTTSKQPIRQEKEQRYQVLLPNIRVQEISRRYLGSHQSLKTSEGTDTLWRQLDHTSMNERKKYFCLLWV